jgi:predicted aspartyl protease
MSIPYDSSFVPPAPVLHIRLASPGESPQGESLAGIADTGSDGTLVPVRILEAIEAIDVGEAILYGVLGETRNVHLYEVDIHIGDVTLPNVIVVGDDHGDEIVIGRNILNGLILLLDGQRNLTDLLERRPNLGMR